MTSLPTEPLPGDDQLGLQRAFERALAQPALTPFFSGGDAGPDACSAAYWLAVTLGRCRLFGVRLGQADGVLPVGIATAAAKELLEHLARWTETSHSLPKTWDTVEDPEEAEEMCFDLLELRMQGWAALIAIEEAYRDCLAGADNALKGFHPLMNRLAAAIPAFDTTLQRQQEFLAVAAETNLLNNWRAMLARPYANVLPWWLDGRLEEIAERVMETAIESEPQRGPSEEPEKELITIHIINHFGVGFPGPVVIEAGLTIEQAFQKGLMPRTVSLRGPTNEYWRVNGERFVGQQVLHDGDTLYFGPRRLMAAAPGFDMQHQEQSAKRDAFVEYLASETLMEIIGQTPLTPVWFLFDPGFPIHIARHTYDIYDAYSHLGNGRIIEAEVPQVASGKDRKPGDLLRIRTWLLDLTQDRDASEQIVMRLQQDLLPFPDRGQLTEQLTRPKAAGKPVEAQSFLNKLATQAPEEAPTDDHRRAWAYLLASASCGTFVRKAWLQRFVTLAAAAVSRGPDWSKRLQLAQTLERDHDWKDLLGDGILRLEPRPFDNLNDLSRWLEELVSPSSQDPFS